MTTRPPDQGLSDQVDTRVFVVAKREGQGSGAGEPAHVATVAVVFRTLVGERDVHVEGDRAWIYAVEQGVSVPLHKVTPIEFPNLQHVPPSSMNRVSTSGEVE